MKKIFILSVVLILLMTSCSEPSSTISDDNNDNFEWTIVKEPTCNQDGKKTRYDEEGNLIEQTIPALGHNWGEWEIDQEPACEYNGYKTRYCSRCDDIEQVDIPATGHTFIGDDLLYDEQTHYQYCTKCQNYVNIEDHNLTLVEEKQLSMPIIINENNDATKLGTDWLYWVTYGRNHSSLSYQTIKGNDKDAKNIISVVNGTNNDDIRCLDEYDDDYYYVNYGSEKVYECDHCGAKIAVKELKTFETIPEIYNSNLFTNAYEAYFEYDEKGNLITVESKYYGIHSSSKDYCYRTINRYFEYDQQNRVISVKTSPDSKYRVGIYYNEEYDNQVYDVVYKCEYYYNLHDEWITNDLDRIYVLYDELGRIYEAKYACTYEMDNSSFTEECLYLLSYYGDELLLSSFIKEDRLVESGVPKPDFGDSYYHNYYFDEYGNMIRSESWTASSNKENVVEYTNAYDSNGLITFQDVYRSSSNNEFYNISYDYDFDEYGNLIYVSARTTCKSIYSNNTAEEFVEADITYDDNGNIISMTVSRYNHPNNNPELVLSNQKTTTFSRVSNVMEDETTILLN